MQTFQEMGLPEALQHTLQHMQFNTPTPIQAQAIPVALKGKDILGSAQTGTGKTGAFGIPLIAKVLSSSGNALVMAPTRELAAQVVKQLEAMLGKRSKIKTALLIGGEAMPKQLRQLRNNPRVVVGTPGRINDHLKRGSLKLNETDFLVLDETDRMLDMGFTIQIENVMAYMPAERQTLLFSATLPKNIVKIAEKYLNTPERVATNDGVTPAKNIKQEILQIKDADKYEALLQELDNRHGSIIAFVKTKYGAEKMAKRLSKEGHEAEAIHGDLRQNKRDKVIKFFRQEKYRILVATDVAARGLDIPHIEHVINYDLPQCPEDYIHRIGRTARAGAKGEALNFVSPADKNKWRAIERLLDPEGKEQSLLKAEKPKKKKPNKTLKGAPKAAPKKAKKSADGQSKNTEKRRNSAEPKKLGVDAKRGYKKPKPHKDAASQAKAPEKRSKKNFGGKTERDTERSAEKNTQRRFKRGLEGSSETAPKKKSFSGKKPNAKKANAKRPKVNAGPKKSFKEGGNAKRLSKSFKGKPKKTGRRG